MSRRENASSGSSSPIQTYLRWHGDGHIEYFDKSVGDKGENVTQDSVELVIIDIRSSITGWHDASESKINSNMVKDSTKEPLTVKAFKANKPLAQGLWADIKEDVGNSGGDFTTNLIAAAKLNGSWVLANLQLSRSNLAVWMEFRKTTTEKEIYDSTVSVTAGEKRKKGKTVFTVPSFELKKLDAKGDKAAEEAYEKVKAYFDSFKPETGRSTNAAPEPTSKRPTPQTESFKEEEHDDLPF